MSKEERNYNLTEVEEKDLEYGAYIEKHRMLVRKVWHKISYKVLGIYGEAVMRKIASRIKDHDISKYSAEEFSAYRRKFYPTSNDLLVPGEIDEDFARAWHHHYHANAHHWSYWVDDKGNALDMPPDAVIEMLVDWQAFGLKAGDTAEEFYTSKGHTFNMTDLTRKRIVKLLSLFEEDKIEETTVTATIEVGVQ